jgi:hypothetical protein
MKDGDEPSKAEFIQETITEESYTEESIVLDNMEIEKPGEEKAMETDQDGVGSKPSESEKKKEETVLNVPKITLQVNSENVEFGSANDVPAIIAKDIKEIEHDAVREVQESPVEDLVMKKGRKENDVDQFESVGSQCNIEDIDKVGNNIESTTDEKVKDDTVKVDNGKTDTGVKAKKKFNVSAAIQEVEDKDIVMLEKPPVKKEKQEKKDIDASSHDEVIFDDEFAEKVSDDEHSKTITSTSDLLNEVSLPIH